MTMGSSPRPPLCQDYKILSILLFYCFLKLIDFFLKCIPLYFVEYLLQYLLLVTLFVNTGTNKCTHLHVCGSVQKQSFHLCKMGYIYEDIGVNAILPKTTWNTSELKKLHLLLVSGKENTHHGELYIPQ